MSLSRVSSGAHSTKSRLRRVDLMTRKAILELEEKLEERLTTHRKCLEVAQSQLPGLEDHLRFLLEQNKDENNMTPEEKGDLRLAKANVHNARTCIQQSQERIQSRQKEFEAARKRIMDRMEIDKELILLEEEEEDEQRLSDSDEQKVREWDMAHKDEMNGCRPAAEATGAGRVPNVINSSPFVDTAATTVPPTPKDYFPVSPILSARFSVRSAEGEKQKERPAMTNDQPYGDPIAQLAQALQKMSHFPHEKDLPVFDGNPEEWCTFITAFRSTTAEYHVSDSKNLLRLQKCLKGKAREVVRALLTSSTNVSMIISVLEKYFGQPTVILRTVIEKVRKMKPVDEKDVDALVEFGSQVTTMVLTINGLDKKNYLENPQLLEELVDKLPTHLRLQWGFCAGECEANLWNFCAWLDGVTDAALRLNRSVLPSERKKERDKKDAAAKGGGRRKESLLATAEDPDDKQEEIKCLFCDKVKHGIEQCYKFKRLSPEKRNEWVKSERRCNCCFKRKHMATSCWNKVSCDVDGCGKLHHHLLHLGSRRNSGNVPPPSAPPESEVLETPEHNGHQIGNSRSVMLRVLPVRIKGPGGTKEIHAICDECSTVSMLDHKVAIELGLKGQSSPLTLKWTDESTQQDLSSRRVGFEIQGSHQRKWFPMSNVRTTAQLRLPYETVPAAKLKKRWKHLRKVNSRDLVGVQPCLLIGQDHIQMILPLEVEVGPANAPVASRCLLGWSIHGRNFPVRNGVDFNCSTVAEESDETLHRMVKESFSLDAMGVCFNEDHLKSKDDRRAEDLMAKYCVRSGDKFEVPLLWKSEEAKLPDNRNEALKRLYGIERKMDRNPEFAAQYCEKVQYYLDRGYAEKLGEDKATQVSKKAWYLPHFFAYHPNKPGKPRFVFDAAAKWKGQSLNSNLVPGPDVLKSLPGILLKFREKRVAFTADIREMFHQVNIRNDDQDAQRFLWRGLNRDRPPDTFVMKVMIFGATCSPYCSQYVKNKNAEDFQQQYPEAAHSIINHHYVDDLADCTDTEEEAKKLIKNIIFVHGQGGFEIVKWISNSEEVMASIPEDLRADGMKNLSTKEEIPIERVLGLLWNPEEDVFQFATSFRKVRPEVVTGEDIPTKREVLKLIMSLFDPLGYLAHFTVKAKIIYQRIWMSEVDWDDKIEEDEFQLWKKWTEQLETVSSVKIPRWLFGGPCNNCQLHLFCDASLQAFTAVAYIRFETEDEDFDSRLTMAKTRVAPLKCLSIEKLELQSAVMAVRLAEFVREQQNIRFSNVHFWSDSKTVILWLRSNVRRYKQFVAHRVGEIWEKTDVNQWHWVSTKDNVADEATRSSPEADLSQDARWFVGPEFLSLPEKDWPEETWTGNQCELELKKEFCAVVEIVEFPHLPEANKFSSLMRLIRTTAQVRRFVLLKCDPDKDRSKYIRVEDLRWAQQEWWKRSQMESFPIEYTLLREKRELPKESKLFPLSPYLDENGIIRVSSRTKLSPNLNEYQKAPILLDPDHQFTKLLVMQYHVWNRHQGQEMVLNELRQKYWIFRARAAVKRAWNSCFTCKNRKSMPVAPEMAPLPEFRVTRPVRAFTICGLDYFGPLTVTKFRKTEKRWGCLFVCMHTRAIHLELVDHLDTDSVIMALTRFASVRGWPQKIYCDNGTNFHGANNELKKSVKELKEKQLVESLAVKEVEFVFQPSLAPHFGGATERMVRSVKKVLVVTLKHHHRSDEVLRTLFAEAVNIVNSRPLCYVAEDREAPEVITPNCFLFGTTSAAPLLGKFEDADLCSRKQWKASQRLADHFWKRWIREYLPTLAKKTKWFRSNSDVKEGDVVLIVDDNHPRNLWVKGEVIAIFPGKDKKTRVVDVRTIHGVYRRPVVKLCVLEGVGSPDDLSVPEGTMLGTQAGEQR